MVIESTPMVNLAVVVGVSEYEYGFPLGSTVTVSLPARIEIVKLQASGRVDVALTPSFGHAELFTK